VGRFYRAVGHFGPGLWAILVHGPFTFKHQRPAHICTGKWCTSTGYVCRQ